MEIGNLPSIGNIIPNAKLNEKSEPNQFGNVFKGVLENAITTRAESADLTRKFVQGGDVELHEVMIAGEKAKTSLQLLMEIRNKSVDMYKQLIRIQI